MNNTNWAGSRTQVLQVASDGLAIMKGNVVTIMTNIGSPVSSLSNNENDDFMSIFQPQNTSMYTYTPWPSSFSSTESVQIVFKLDRAQS